MILDDLELLPNEKLLMENGKGDTVMQVRSQYQQAIQTTFQAAIERATGARWSDSPAPRASKSRVSPPRSSSWSSG